MTGVQVEPFTLERELKEAAESLDRAATRLYRLTREFEGEGEGDDWQPGPQLRWLDLVGDELDRIATEYEDREKRPPAKEILQVRSEKAARRRDPELYAEYHRLKSEIEAIQKWASAKSKTISARQSVLRGERG